jgi:ubiquinone/menaquinone biosynthesis C-methylase UbiE
MNAALADAHLTIESAPAPSVWEEAYLRFETPEQEVHKFEKRLVKLGARNWALDSKIVELFCGRGNGLRALHNFGFDNIEGIDISPCLASRYRGPGQIIVADCRELPLPDASRDVLIVQGGLHHLPCLPEDLEQTLAGAARVLRRGGRFVMVEPCRTPFLTFVHFVSELRVSRAFSNKLDAFATMTANEHETYYRWLDDRDCVFALLHKFFEIEREFVGWGKMNFVGVKR